MVLLNARERQGVVDSMNGRIAIGWLRLNSARMRQLEERDDPLAQPPVTTEEKYLAKRVVLVGYGRVGRHIAEALTAGGVPVVVADHNRERVEALRHQGVPAVRGDASGLRC